MEHHRFRRLAARTTASAAGDRISLGCVEPPVQSDKGERRLAAAIVRAGHHGGSLDARRRKAPLRPLPMRPARPSQSSCLCACRFVCRGLSCGRPRGCRRPLAGPRPSLPVLVPAQEMQALPDRSTRGRTRYGQRSQSACGSASPQAQDVQIHPARKAAAGCSRRVLTLVRTAPARGVA